MRSALSWVVLSLLLSLAPSALGVEAVVDDETCIDALACVPSTVCVPGVVCQVSPCDPVNECAAGARYSEWCEVNQTIDGQTCSEGVDATAEAGGRNVVLPGTYVIPGRPVPGVSVDVPETRLDAEVNLTRGYVHDRNLSNEWRSDAFRVSLVLLGEDFGETGASVYRSTIQAPGGDDEMHEYEHGTVSVRHESANARGGAAAGFVLLDGALESCFVRAGPAADFETSCRELYETLGV